MTAIALPLALGAIASAGERVPAGAPVRGDATVAALGWHEVTERPLTSGFVRPGAVPFTVTPRLFEAQLDAIAAGAPSPTLVGDPAFDGPGHRTLLTFDDGGRSACRAAEALERRGWRGHFFVVTERIGERSFLPAADIRALRRAGHIVGSHSHTHPDIFRDLDERRMVEEWRISMDVLAQLLGERCEAAAVPGGHVSRRALRSADIAGLHHLFTCRPVLRPWRVGGCVMIGRVLVKSGTTPRRVGALAAGRGWRRAFVERGAKDVVRRCAAPLFRAYMRWSTRNVDPIEVERAGRPVGSVQ